MSEADYRVLERLASVIDARKTYLKGETTEKAVTATCINILVSLRADTAVVGRRPTVFDGRYLIEIEDTNLVGGWAHPQRSGKKGRRVARPAGGGHAIDMHQGGRVVNLAGNYARCRDGKVYSLAIYNKDGNGKPFYPAKADSCYVIAANVDDVVKFARLRISRRIGQYRGVSKRALGAAMRAFRANRSGESVSGDLQRLADSVVDVTRMVEGVDSGRVRITVADNLPHAEQALRSGSVNQAMMKAANRTVGIINRSIDKVGRMWERLESPFPEVIEGASRRSAARGSSGLYMASRDTLIRMVV